jgi:mannosyl-3-phosphoglycerate phosphatase
LNKRVVIFTDLDGTLLDAESYSFDSALGALMTVKERYIPLAIISSKTAKEIMHYRKLLHNRHPFVSENGGGIFIPKGYFKELPFWIPITEKYGYDMIGQGVPYAELVSALQKLKSMGFSIRGFSDMTVPEIMEETGLSEEEAVFSKERDFDEPVIIGENVDMQSLTKAIKDMGLKYTFGKYLHLMGKNDKGRAVKELRDMFRKELGEIITVAIGDSINDIPMFLNVDYPVAVKKADGKHDETVLNEIPNIRISEGIGPEGFNACIKTIIGELHEND